jgi:hypothetical protein
MYLSRHGAAVRAARYNTVVSNTVVSNLGVYGTGVYRTGAASPCASA